MTRRALAIAIALLGCGKDKPSNPGIDADVTVDSAADAPDPGPDAPTVPACDPAIGPQLRCEGDVLQTCNAGEIESTDCTASGQVCAWVSDTTGYGCVDPAMTGALVVTGTIRYEDRPPNVDGSLGAIELRPARGARVSVVRDSNSAVLATAGVADDGTYRLRYDATAGQQVHILATAQNLLPARPIKVVNRQGAVHGFGGTAFAAAASSTSDILVTEASDRGEAFNVLDMCVITMDGIREVLGNPTPTPLTAEWARGSNNGTFYSRNAIHLLGANSDDDGYDDTVILHETGHFVEDSEGRSDSPGGSHDGSPTDPRLAWSEGFSTYWAMAMRNVPEYMDSNANGGFGYNADASVTAAAPAGGVGQDVSEEMVTEDLWDLADGGATDDDDISAGHTSVLRVQVDYLAPGNFRDVGVAGVDLVDFLDGWFVAVGLSPCTSARGVVTDTRMFPYDYAGPAGACP